MKRQLSNTPSVDEPQRNVRRAVSLEQPHVNFPPGVQSKAPNLLADHQNTTSVSGEIISNSLDTPQGLQALAGSTTPHACVHRGGLMSALDGRCNSLSSEVPPPSSNPLVISTFPNLRCNIPASEERSTVLLPSMSPVDEPQRHLRIRNPFARSTARHFRVFTMQTMRERQGVASLEQPHGFQPRVQSVASPPASNPLVPSMASQLRSHYNLIPAGPSLIDRINYRRVTLTRARRVILTRAASLVGSRSLVRIAVSHHSEQPQNRTSQGQTSNHSQYQNPQITQAFLRHRDMHMDINSLSYEELLELEERIGKVNTGIKTSELSKFVKEVICCGEQDEEERCVICLEQYADADVKGQLMCGHEYHFSCIGKWMEEQAVCPICKQRAAQFEQ